ncbi:hypothetical protein [Amycolatopsis magusensis]|uniref:hypothetical protein n=1 Tax=Amycolatopsis magusensis TaxID=882444 RepID=UPI003C2BEDAA
MSTPEWVSTRQIPAVDSYGLRLPLLVGIVRSPAGRRMAYKIGATGATCILQHPRDIGTSLLIQRTVAEEVIIRGPWEIG